MKGIRSMVLLGVLLGVAMTGCGKDSTTNAQFAASTTPTTPGLIKMAQASASGTQVVVDVLLFGPEPNLDLYASRFGIRIADPSAVRLLPQTTYAQSALVASQGQTIRIAVDGSDPSLVEVETVKQGGGAGNGFTSPAVVLIELTFEVTGTGGSSLSFSGLDGNPPQALDTGRLPLAGVRFDTQAASIAGIRTGGGGY
jgi:hypothetical protein